VKWCIRYWVGGSSKKFYGFNERLDSYAWKLGVVDEGQRKYAIQEAHKLIDKMRNNPVFGWLQEAKQIYREIPFVYRK